MQNIFLAEAQWRRGEKVFLAKAQWRRGEKVFLAKAQWRRGEKVFLAEAQWRREMNKPYLMHENELSGIILDVAFEVHKTLGPGLFESVYEEVMWHELTVHCGLLVKRQEVIPVVWRQVRMDMAFRADLIVEGKVLVELKSIESISAVHPKQVLTYLKLTGLKLGLLLNFNETLLRNGIKRIVNGL